LSYAGNNENTIFIKDKKNGRVAPVRVVIKENGHLICSASLTRETIVCTWVLFFALPEFYKILKEKGVKPRALT